MKKFKDTGREQSSTFRYWISFLNAGDTLLKLLRADREADFEMHLTAVLEVIPYLFLACRSNYARYTPVYVAEMRHLGVSAPRMFQHMSEGGFLVKRSERTFNCVPADQALEQNPTIPNLSCSKVWRGQANFLALDRSTNKSTNSSKGVIRN